MSTDQYNDFALNASGLSNISKTGVSKFGLRLTQEIAGDPTWVSEATNSLRFQAADGANAPKLIVTYTKPEGGGNPMFFGGGVTVG